MTTQAQDNTWYRGRMFSVVAVERGKWPIFAPESQGVIPTPVSSANWRGYVCSYVVSEGKLRLGALSLNAWGEPAEVALRLPAIWGCHPIVTRHRDRIRAILPQLYDPDDDSLSIDYEFSDHPDEAPILPFTGGILLATDYVDEERRRFMRGGWNMHGVGKLLRYAEVHELLFEEGRLVSEWDHSIPIEDIRRWCRSEVGDVNRKHTISNNSFHPDELCRLVTPCLNREYE